jgi:hypothetical protein
VKTTTKGDTKMALKKRREKWVTDQHTILSEFG